MDDNNIRQAFSEISEILNIMPKELTEKIPNKFYKMIEEHKDGKYFPKIKEPIQKEELKKETLIILALIYRDFLCSEEERKILQNKDAEEIREMERKLEEQYNPSELFKKRKRNISNKIIQQEEVQENNDLIILKEKWYKKIIDSIKNFFHINKL